MSKRKEDLVSACCRAQLKVLMDKGLVEEYTPAYRELYEEMHEEAGYLYESAFLLGEMA
jgi:hypothetical protein